MTVRKLTAFLLALLLMLSLTACGGSSKAENSAALYSADMAPQEAPMAMPEMEMGSDYAYGETTAASGTLSAESGSVSTPPAQRKWVITMNISAETEDLDAMTGALDEHIKALDGFVEDQHIYNGSAYASRRYRSASLTIRIPAESVDQFTREVSGISNVISQEKNLEDITLNYVSTESRMTALQTEEARLLELMERAETMADLLEIEARLTDVRYELESVTSRLRTYDNQVNYATIHLDISEVQEYTPVEDPTLWERLSGGFTDSLKDLWDSLQDLLVFLVVAFPFLLVYGGIALAVFLVVRSFVKKKSGAKKQPWKLPEKKDETKTE